MTTLNHRFLSFSHRVVEAYRLDRYDNMLSPLLELDGDGCRSLSFG